MAASSWIAYLVTFVVINVAFVHGDMKFMLRTYEECSGEVECLKLKLVMGLQRAGRASEINLIDGVRLVKDPKATDQPQITEQQIEATLPRSADAKDSALDSLIQDGLSRFFNSHQIQFKLSDFGFGSTSVEDEGRARRRRGLATLLLLWLLMAGLMIPVKLGALAMLAGKALIVSKLALALAAIVGLKKLLSSGEHEPSYQVVQVPHHGHRRNFELPYSAYAPKSEEEN